MRGWWTKKERKASSCGQINVRNSHETWREHKLLTGFPGQRAIILHSLVLNLKLSKILPSSGSLSTHSHPLPYFQLRSLCLLFACKSVFFSITGEIIGELGRHDSKRRAIAGWHFGRFGYGCGAQRLASEFFMNFRLLIQREKAATPEHSGPNSTPPIERQRWECLTASTIKLEVAIVNG